MQDKRELTKQFSQGHEGSASAVEPTEGSRSQNGDGSGRKVRSLCLSEDPCRCRRVWVLLCLSHENRHQVPCSCQPRLRPAPMGAAAAGCDHAAYIDLALAAHLAPSWELLGRLAACLLEYETGTDRTKWRQGAATQHTLISRFMPTSRRIVQFSDGRSAPPDARIVYIDGAFDLFHPGHVQILKARTSLLEF